MRSPHLSAIAALSGAVGLLGPSRELTLSHIDPDRSDRDGTPSTSRAAIATSQSTTASSSSINGGGVYNWLRRLPSPLPSLVCHADASGYDAIDTRPSPASASVHSLPGAQDVDTGDEGDTITGVFHRLDPQRAKLVQVQVVFRHGARTPLSARPDLWSGRRWDVCGEAYKAAALRLFSTAGVENPVSNHDQRQRSVILDGGCRKGELTLLGQAQARELGRWLRSRYVAQYEFLPLHISQDGVVETRTTNVSRTIATLRGVLTGLYPDLAKQQQQQQQQQAGPQAKPQSQPFFPRTTTSADLDEILYADTRACPHLGSFQSLSREAGRGAIRADPEYEWARNELMRLMDMDGPAFDAEKWIFTEVHDVMTSLAAHGKSLPPGFEQPRLLAAVNRLATKEFATEVAPSVRDSHGRTILRLSMGRLLHIMVDNMEGAVAAASQQSSPSAQQGPDGGAGRPKMYLYSG